MHNIPPYYAMPNAWQAMPYPPNFQPMPYYAGYQTMPMQGYAQFAPTYPQVMSQLNPPMAQSSLMGTLTSSSFIKGAVIGGVAAYVLTNENVQNGVIKAAVQSWSILQGGIEEMKERFRDAEAELHAAQHED